MKKSLFYFTVGSIFVFLFLLFTYLTHKDLFTQLDFDTTVKLQDNLPRRLDGFFSFFSVAGNFEVLLLALVALLFSAKKIIAGLVAFGVFGFFHVVELAAKLFIKHPPPPEFMLRTEHPIDLPQFHIRSEYSYPSGHSGRTVFLSVLLLFFVWRSKKLPFWLKVIITFVILGVNSIMLISRIYLGEHWLSDVIGGVLLALGMSIMSLTVFTWPKTGKLSIFSK